MTDDQSMGLELEVYSFSDPTQLLDIIPRRQDLTYMEEVNGVGGGSFSIHADDQKLKDTPNLLDYRNVVKVRLEGKVVGGFVIQQKETVIVDADGTSAEVIKVSGEGLRTWFSDAAVYPYKGLKATSPTSREFSFASERGDWYDDSQWITPHNLQAYSLTQTTANKIKFGTAPANGPWDGLDNEVDTQHGDSVTVTTQPVNAYWVWSQDNNKTTNKAPIGFNYFRKEFTLTEALADYSIFVAADDQYEVYFDGQQVAATDLMGGSSNWVQTNRIDLADVPAGDHIIAVRVYNKTGRAGMILALRQAGIAAQNTDAKTILATGFNDDYSSEPWRVLAYPTTPPGWTPGEVILTLMNEAKARGVHFANWLTPFFDGTFDSSGTRWTTPLDWSFDIGSGLDSVVQKMEEVSCDVWIDPGNMSLSVYVERGTHRDTGANPVVFRIGQNIKVGGEIGLADLKNTLLLQTNDGWQVETDQESVSISQYGRIEATLATGASKMISKDVATHAFHQFSQPQTSSTYDILAVDGTQPFFDFYVGDWVLAPDSSRQNLVSRRVMSISLAEDNDTGIVGYSLEFDSIFQDQEARLNRWMNALASNMLGGLIANVGKPPKPSGKGSKGGGNKPPAPDVNDKDPGTGGGTGGDGGTGGTGGTGGSGGSTVVYVQPDEPSDTRIGVLWFDTDASYG